jgi:hypothetical protein
MLQELINDTNGYKDMNRLVTSEYLPRPAYITTYENRRSPFKVTSITKLEMIVIVPWACLLQGPHGLQPRLLLQLSDVGAHDAPLYMW